VDYIQSTDSAVEFNYILPNFLPATSIQELPIFTLKTIFYTMASPPKKNAVRDCSVDLNLTQSFKLFM